MQYPFFDFPFYHHQPDIDLKRIYPIGSIIFRSSPLANKTEWTDVSRDDPHFPVDWEGMTWELIVDPIPSYAFSYASTQVHSIRNCRLRLTATEGQIRNRVFNGKMIIDGQDVGTFQLDTFTGENSHKLIEEEMPAHNHFLYSWYNPDSSGSNDGVLFQRMANQVDYIQAGYGGNSFVGSKGGNQSHNNKEYAYNLFMYKRIA